MLVVVLLAGCVSVTVAPTPVAPVDAGVPARPPEPPGTPDAEFRNARPAPLATKSAYEAPVPVERTLKNGARLLVVESHSVPLVSIEVLIAIGADGDPAGKRGLAGFTADMLREGSVTHPSQQLAGELEDLAARLTSSSGLETSSVRLNCLKDTLPQALDLLTEVLVNPAFAPADLERVRALLLTDLVQKKGSPVALAADEAARLSWGDKHPWGQPEGGTPESVKAITRDDLVRFHQAWYRPGNAIVSVAGDVTPDEIEGLLKARWSGWTGKAAARPKLPAVPAPSERTITLIDKPGATQSQVWVVGRGVPANHPDRVALGLANAILGGSFGSRINMNLREARGYSYGARMSLSSLKEHGLWIASSGIKANVTAEAVTEFEKELVTFESGALREGELARAKEQALRALPGSLETVDAVAGRMAMLAFHGLPLDEERRLPAKIAAVDEAEVARVVKTWLHAAQFPVVVVGPATNQAALEGLGLGTVKVVSAPAPAPASR